MTPGDGGNATSLALLDLFSSFWNHWSWHVFDWLRGLDGRHCFAVVHLPSSQQVLVDVCGGEMPTSRPPLCGMPHDFSLLLLLLNIHIKQMGEIIWKQVVPTLFLYHWPCFHLPGSGDELFLTHDRETHLLTKPMNNLETLLNAQKFENPVWESGDGLARGVYRFNLCPFLKHLMPCSQSFMIWSHPS